MSKIIRIKDDIVVIELDDKSIREARNQIVNLFLKLVWK